MRAGSVVLLMPSPDDGGTASLQLLQALIAASPEAQGQAASLGCGVRAALGGVSHQRADITWREGTQLRSDPTPYAHLAAISQVQWGKLAVSMGWGWGCVTGNNPGNHSWESIFGVTYKWCACTNLTIWSPVYLLTSKLHELIDPVPSFLRVLWVGAAWVWCGCTAAEERGR